MVTGFMIGNSWRAPSAAVRAVAMVTTPQKAKRATRIRRKARAEYQLEITSLRKYPPSSETGMKSMITTEVPVINPPPGNLNASRLAKKRSCIIHKINVSACRGDFNSIQTIPRLANTSDCLPYAVVK